MEENLPGKALCGLTGRAGEEVSEAKQAVIEMRMAEVRSPHRSWDRCRMIAGIR